MTAFTGNGRPHASQIFIVRDLRGNPALPNSLRISVGTRAQNDALLDSVEAA